MQLGYALHYGTGITKDEKRAATLFKRACQMAGLAPDCAEKTMR
jgi:TPR repeat protein